MKTPFRALAALGAALLCLRALSMGDVGGAQALPEAQLPAPQLVRVALPQAEEAQTPAPSQDICLTVYDASEKKNVSMELEDYVLYALIGEMPASFAPEALKAQAVAARSYALWKSARFGGGGCRQSAAADVCTDSACCMAFADPAALKARWGGAYEQTLAVYRQAVEETRGLVCTYEGKPIQALFHAVSGGQTEDAAAVFSQALPYLVSVQSIGEEEARRFAQTQTFSRQKLAKALNAAFPGAGLSASALEEQLQPLSRSDSGRVGEMRVGSVTVTGRQMRKALGLNSTNFRFYFAKDAVRIQTLGFGHGVGLSQAGADAMARDGADYEQILLHYYTGVRIAPLTELEAPP